MYEAKRETNNMKQMPKMPRCTRLAGLLKHSNEKDLTSPSNIL
jgi:hypothetical protein